MPFHFAQQFLLELLNSGTNSLTTTILKLIVNRGGFIYENPFYYSRFINCCSQPFCRSFFSLSMQNVGKQTRGRYHSNWWWSSRLHSDEPAIGERSLFRIRNRRRAKFNKRSSNRG